MVGFISVFAWLGLAQLFSRRWPWELTGPAPSQSDIFKLALGMAAAVGATVALVVNYRRQNHLEVDSAGQRDQIRLLTERFGAAAAQLGGEQAAVRLAGVFALAALADEWEERRQQCIDVLCGYLRLPYVGEPPAGHPELIVEQQSSADGLRQRSATTSYRAGEREVRQAIVNTITEHLQADARISWSSYDFDFDGATLVNASFHGAVFAGARTSFYATTFVGLRTTFNRACFVGKSVWFIKAEFRTGDTDFTKVDFRPANRIWFAGASFLGDCSFDLSTFDSPTVGFDLVTFTGSETDFFGVTFPGSGVTFTGALFDSARTSFENTRFGSHARVESPDHPLSAAHFATAGKVNWGSRGITPGWRPTSRRTDEERARLNDSLFWPSKKSPPSAAAPAS
ncbi:pentapeptide repeat-containing protein [Kribbella sancticallisti]|uniref:Pentapeptide repeat-containing protein n=2 Tax=Kribbella sancticallisti TaxID=460087 RepID=A0ABN2E1N1_9ACTN